MRFPPGKRTVPYRLRANVFHPRRNPALGENPKILFPVHQELINYNGIYLLENMDTRELAKDKAYEFMFVLGPARVSGAVQMIINPTAIR